MLIIKNANYMVFNYEKEKNFCCNYKQEQDFDDINIIFGMNGFGKTAISRLINSYSSLINRDRDNDIKGKIAFEDKNYNKKDEKNKILVYNADFIQENLIYNSENNTSINDYFLIFLLLRRNIIKKY